MLQGGVILSLLLLTLGFFVSVKGNEPWIGTTDLNELISGGTNLRSDPPRNLAQLNYVQGAILLLILLPGFRVAFLLGSFARQRDLAFTLIATSVLILMSSGMIFELIR
jgi:uncharacterized membrane protein